MASAYSRPVPLLVAALSTGLPVLALAEPAPIHYDLERTSWAFLGVETLAAGAAYASAWIFTGGPSKHCHWCQTNRFDDAIRSELRVDDPRPAAFVSHALSVGAIPVLGLTGLVAPAALDEQWHRGLEDTWIIANTFLVTSAVGDAVKHLAARQRPAFLYQRQADTEFAPYPSERNKSFFSLDTAWAFSIASSATTLAYLRGYSTAPYIAVGGALLAVGTGTLRIVSDAHWATDVMAGAVVGTGVGIALPLLMHGRRDASGDSTAVSVAPLAQGTGVSVSMQF